MQQNHSKPVTHCQVCNSQNLQSELFVGYIPPVNLMPEINAPLAEQPTFPLELIRCKDCTLVQIGCEVDQKILFPLEYPYLSGSTKILRENFADLCRESTSLVKIQKTDLVIDIGSNDGTLLSNFHNAGYKVLGVEPTQAANVALKNGINTLQAFFNAETAEKVKREHGQPKIITAANVFAHIGNINNIVSTITSLLPDDGVFISESHYLVDLVRDLQYDTIYHEHLRYYTVLSLTNLLKRHGLHVFHVKAIPSHGGSIRVYAAKNPKLYPALPSVAEFEKSETQQGYADGKALQHFRERVFKTKYDLLSLLSSLKNDKMKIYGIGAPSRASTLINFVGIDESYLDCIMEISTSHKLNKFIPGTRIAVLDEAKLYKDQPEYVLLLSWHIADEMISSLKARGYKGKFIVPLPQPKIVN